MGTWEAKQRKWLILLSTQISSLESKNNPQFHILLCLHTLRHANPFVVFPWHKGVFPQEYTFLRRQKENLWISAILRSKEPAKVPFCRELLITVINFTRILLFVLIMVIMAMESQEKNLESFPSCYQFIVEIRFTFSSLSQGVFGTIHHSQLVSVFPVTENRI